MVRVQLDTHRPTSTARRTIAAYHRVGPCALFTGAVGMPALPIRVILPSRVAPFDAACVGAEPLLSEGRYRLVVLDGVDFAAILASLAANATLPERVILPRPVLGPPLPDAFIRAETICFRSRRGYRLLSLTPFTMDDDGHSPSYYRYGPKVKA
jgi:hypothetical protein